MKLKHFNQTIDVDIKQIDKIEITDVNCLTGPMNTITVTKNNYPKFDELLSILEKYDGITYCTSYIIISFYKGNEELGYITIDFPDDSFYKEASNAIQQVKDWFKKK